MPISNEAEIMEEFGLSEKKYKTLKKRFQEVEGRDDKAFMDLLRTVNRNHYTLNQMVDRKARILLSIDALILSLIIGKFLVNHTMHDFKFLVMLLIGITCGISIVYSMLAVMPERSHDSKVAGDSRESENPLFFGDFREMTENEYETKMMAMITDRDFIYRSIIQDTYQLGVVLERKRRWLTISLYSLTGGLCVALTLSLLFRSLLE